MTISKIKVNEYQCVKCGYKWINRINGKDVPIPDRCAKCKKHNWNKKEDDISPEERGLRTRIRSIKNLYEYSSLYWSNTSIADFWNNDLAEGFLRTNPRPTIAELRRVLYPPGLKIGLTSQNHHRRRGYVPDPQKPGWLKYDEKEYIETLQWEARERQKLMQQIIEKRQ
ncbi:MAG: hypothetical protein ACRD8W_22815 [Nitrososphaeraceae archaeon]